MKHDDEFSAATLTKLPTSLRHEWFNPHIQKMCVDIDVYRGAFTWKLERFFEDSHRHISRACLLIRNLCEADAVNVTRHHGTSRRPLHSEVDVTVIN